MALGPFPKIAKKSLYKVSGYIVLLVFFYNLFSVQAPTQTTTSPTKVVVPLTDETENITRWIVDQNFRRDQERLKIPFGKKKLWHIAVIVNYFKLIENWSF